ncbi:YaaA family protein [Antribacter gilvus]|uniref:YaaA family protein n=1 Tax=Antribacter gilvus TaxID=2304675 RepID=UPI000F7BA7C4|nr:peroxide stress protein YaaA [Antribacter gilvus]
MLLLLPPSEGKTPAPDGAAPLDLAALAHPELTTQRDLVLDALAAASARPDATTILGVSEGLADEVARNTGLRTAPTAPAAQVYTGVLYAAAGLAHLDGPAARRAQESVRIFSGLWGAVAPGDRIPAYRLSMGVTLPDVGPLARAWKPALASALDGRAAGDVVVDCRSATYVAAWRPEVSGADAADWVEVRVLREVDGKRSVVSHNAKHTRGVLAGHLLRREAEPTSAEEVLKATQELVGTVLLTEIGSGRDQTLIEVSLLDGRARGPRTLELVLA